MLHSTCNHFVHILSCKEESYIKLQGFPVQGQELDLVIFLCHFQIRVFYLMLHRKPVLRGKLEM